MDSIIIIWTRIDYPLNKFKWNPIETSPSFLLSCPPFPNIQVQGEMFRIIISASIALTIVHVNMYSME